MRGIVLKYGLIAGAILGTVMFASYPFRDQIGIGTLGMVIGYTSMVLAFLMIHAGMRTYRDTLAGGSVSYGRALVVGLLIMLVGSAIYVACWEFVFFVLSPDFADHYAQVAVDNARAAGKTEAEVAAVAAEMQAFAASYKNPLVNIAYTFLEPLPVGLLFSFVSAWLVSRRSNASLTGAAPA